MLPSATTPVVQPIYEDGHTNPRRIRHITGIQIRNLTPFPVRDAFTSALTRPAEQPHFNASGVIDDLGAMILRKRTRKVSTNSTGTRRSLKWDDGILDQKDMSPSVESRGRATSISSTTLTNNGNPSTSPSNGTQPFSSSRSTHSLRGRRARTSSMASSSSNHLANISFPAGSSSTSIPSLLPDNSQAGLEKVINSRLVETFIAIGVPTRTGQELESSSSNLLSPSGGSQIALRSAPLQASSFLPTSRSQKLVSVAPSSTKDSLTVVPLHKKQSSTPNSAPPSKTAFKLAIKQDIRPRGPSNTLLNGISPPSPVSSPRKGKSVANPPSEMEKVVTNKSESPVYFSPIHRPSTNPFFPIDARSGRDFPQWSDTSGHSLKIEVWGKVAVRGRREEWALHGRQHQTEPPIDDDAHDWKLLDERDINLNKLIPLPDDLDTNPSALPSNTVLVTLSPPGQTLYLPPSLTSVSRSSSPSGGYTSDPESEIRKAKQDNDQPHSTADVLSPAEILPLSRRRRHKGIQSPADLRDNAKTAGWLELFKLVTIQSLILDNESSLGEVVRKIDGLLEDDETFPLRREISEREAHIKELSTNYNVVVELSAKRKLEIADRAQRLKTRADLLASARDALQLNSEMDDRIDTERTRLILMRERMASARTSLLSTLSTIFPIELYSPPDLLFTILDVPLPIPLNSNDPAPPLTMPEHKEVTEEAVATALGYVAQVLQILAAYIGKHLIYPVTCIGSRSLIRDGISAMVGPRMFPLFSKGVDTYRFEYGVFLLNKDIEMLMSERDLRALDIRHTLPNLKNLLLTLSDDNVHKYQPRRSNPSPVCSTSGLETPPRESSPVAEDIHTPKASHALVTGTPVEGTTTPTASGATTPTTSIMSDDSRKQRSFLGFVPFTDFLRARYPSTSQSSEKTVTKSRASSRSREESEGDTEADGGSEPDEEDRMTIHAVASENHDNLPDALAREGSTATET
ncbi:hypothetical protein BDZ97DRAFT_1912290 [Flammula alnicola]|nr:hypothetical protein BDZ97DRAFT_1912290 [Flammula alnicola]